MWCLVFVSFTTIQLICSVPAVIGAITGLPFFHTGLIVTSHHAWRTFPRKRRWWWREREKRKSHQNLRCKWSWAPLCSLDGTHQEEHSLKTPAGQWPHLPFGPGSVASETGSEKLREYGQGRCYPPSSFERWWPQDATLQPLESPGDWWKPTRGLSPDPFDLIIHGINRTR